MMRNYRKLCADLRRHSDLLIAEARELREASRALRQSAAPGDDCQTECAARLDAAPVKLTSSLERRKLHQG